MSGQIISWLDTVVKFILTEKPDIIFTDPPLPLPQMARARTRTEAQSPLGSFCMNYRLLMRGYKTPSAQEAVHFLAALLDSASSVQIK